MRQNPAKGREAAIERAAYALYEYDCERSKREMSDLVWKRVRDTYIKSATVALNAAGRLA